MLKKFVFGVVIVFAAVTPARSVTLLGVDIDNNLISFDSSSPGMTMSSVAISGIGGASVLSMDMRVLDNKLYALTDDKRIFTVDQLTGAATLFANVSSITGSQFAFDFNPTNHNLRLVGNDNSNYVFNMVTNALISAPSVAYGFGGPTSQRIAAAAYLNNDLSGSTGTTLYVLDSLNDVLATQNAATGILTVIGALGADFSSRASFDIFTDGTGNMPFAHSGNKLYSIDLNSGLASAIGNTDRTLFALTAVTAVPEPSEWLMMTFGLGVVGLIGARKRKVKQA
jgi:Domain of unknown function (DUF4394)